MLRSLRGGGGPGAADLDEARQILETLTTFLVEDERKPAAAEVLLADEAARVALLRLVAVACRLRLPPLTLAATAHAGGGGGPRPADDPDACAFVFLTCVLGIKAVFVPPPERFVLPLVRMGTVQAVARQLAAAAAELGGAGGADMTAPSNGSPSSTQPLQPAAPANSVHQALSVCMELIKLMLHAAYFTPTNWQPPNARALQALRCELAAAVRDSRLLEHAGRLLLAMATAPVGLLPPPAVGEQLGRALAVMHIFIFNFLDKQSEPGADEDACGDALRAVLAGPCAQHAALALCVIAVCAADGGPSYGLPQQLLERGRSLAPLTQATGAWQVYTLSLSELAAALFASTDASAPGRRSRVSLLLRIARIALASAEAWAGGGSLSPRIEQEVSAAEAFKSLHSALSLLSAHPSRHTWWAESAVEAWRLAVAATQPAVLSITASERLGGLANLLALPSSLFEDAPLVDTGPPPPMLAAALQSGLLPCLERLLRRAGEEPLGKEAQVVAGALEPDECCSLLAALLVYGDAPDTAALVATLRKLLLRAAARPLAVVVAEGLHVGVDERGLACGSMWSAGIASALLDHGTTLLHDCCAQPGAEPLSGRLACMLSLAARDWLPPLSELALRTLLAAPRGVPDSTSEAVVHVALWWLLLLAWRDMPSCGGAGAGGAASATSGDAAQWRALLLREMRAGALLNAALHAAQRKSEELWDGFKPLVAHVCCAVAAAAALEAEGSGSAAQNIAAAESAGGCGSRAAAAAVPTLASLRWRPELLLGLAEALEAQGNGDLAPAVRAVAALVGPAEDGAGAAGGAEACTALVLRVSLDALGGVRVADRLVWPSEAVGIPRVGCSYPRCTQLGGDSEAGVPLAACEACGACSYCCDACRAAHWREGHAGVCTRAPAGSRA